MNTALTVIQILLALLMTVAGFLKLSRPYDKFVKMPYQGWANDFKPAHIRLIGVIELCAAVGLIISLLVPSLTILTTVAAVGIALILAGAMVTHLRRDEYTNMVGNFVWLSLALFVGYSSLVGFAV